MLNTSGQPYHLILMYVSCHLNLDIQVQLFLIFDHQVDVQKDRQPSFIKSVSCDTFVILGLKNPTVPLSAVFITNILYGRPTWFLRDQYHQNFPWLRHILLDFFWVLFGFSKSNSGGGVLILVILLLIGTYSRYLYNCNTAKVFMFLESNYFFELIVQLISFMDIINAFVFSVNVFNVPKKSSVPWLSNDESNTSSRIRRLVFTEFFILQLLAMWIVMQDRFSSFSLREVIIFKNINLTRLFLWSSHRVQNQHRILDWKKILVDQLVHDRHILFDDLGLNPFVSKQ